MTPQSHEWFSAPLCRLKNFCFQQSELRLRNSLRGETFLSFCVVAELFLRLAADAPEMIEKQKKAKPEQPACLPCGSETFSEPPDRRNKTLFPPRLLVSRSSTCDLLLCYSFILSTCLKSPVVSPPSFRLLSASGSFFLSMFCEQKASCLCLLPVQRRAAAYPPVTYCCCVLKRLFPGEARAFPSLSVNMLRVIPLSESSQ